MLDIESPSTTRSKLKHLRTPPHKQLGSGGLPFKRKSSFYVSWWNHLVTFVVFLVAPKTIRKKICQSQIAHHFANKNQGVKIFLWGKKTKKNTTCRPCFWISFPPPPMTRWPRMIHGIPGPTILGNHHTPEKSQPNVLSIYRWSLTGWLFLWIYRLKPRNPKKNAFFC